MPLHVGERLLHDPEERLLQARREPAVLAGHVEGAGHAGPVPERVRVAAHGGHQAEVVERVRAEVEHELAHVGNDIAHRILELRQLLAEPVRVGFGDLVQDLGSEH